MTHSNVRFQVDPTSAPSLPPWMEEVAAVAHILTQTGFISALEEHVRFARARFGTFGGPGNGDLRGELQRACQVATTYATNHQLLPSQILLRLDGG